MLPNPHGDDEWRLTWRSPFQTLAYEPIYLANGSFGGLLDLSGSTLDLWSSEIGAQNLADEDSAVLWPVTALRTAVYFRNDHYRAAQTWVGASGIHCVDPRYTSTDGIPHIPQVYECRQELDLRTGVATTAGSLYLGSEAALVAGQAPERVIPFETRVIFLKDSRLLGIEVTAADDTEILVAPDIVPDEHLTLGAADRGIARLGVDAIACDLRFRKTTTASAVTDGRLAFAVQPERGTPYVAIVSAPGTRATTLGNRPALLGRGRMFFTVEIRSGETDVAAAAEAPWTFAGLRTEQHGRWARFWAESDVKLPASERLWQQRYRTSLFYVAQSVGDGPTHPGGLSRPMFPYWHGCFHDTDTYFCRALLETGHFDEAGRHLSYRHRHLPVAREVAKRAGRSGALYPWQTDVRGQGGVHDVPINGAIIACEAWHHGRHHGRTEARIMAREILGETLDYLADHLDLAAEPLAFWPRPLMTFSETMVAEDPPEVRLALRAVAAAWLEAEDSPADSDRIALARRILAELSLPERDGHYAIGSADEPEYLRCPSVTLGSFPLHHLPADGRLARTFDEELARILLLFAWLPHHASVVASQLRRNDGPTSAAELLRQADAFFKPWHACDEWENRRSVRAAVFVTAAGGFCTAIHHMLVAETAADVWTVFPAAPTDWSEVAFRDLSTRAGWRISARLEGGALTSVSAAPEPGAARSITLELPRSHPELLARLGGQVSVALEPGRRFSLAL